jgi:type I restriction enzyme, S subunit
MNRWETKKLGEIATIQMGQSPPGETYNSDGVGLPFFQGKAEFGEEYPTRVKWCSQPSRIAEAGDILLSVRAPVGPTNFATERCCIERGLAAIRGEPKKCNQRYIRYYLKRFEFDIAARGVGSTFTAINRNDIERLELPVPLLAEQERIVKLLDEADELQQLRTQADRRTAALIPSLFHEMFGDPTHLERMHWSFKPLGEFAKVSYGLADKLDATTKPENGTRILTIFNILLHGSINTGVEKYSVVEPAERAKARLQKFDLLFNWRNGSEEHVGKTAIWEEQVEGEVLHVSFLLKIRADPDQANPYFLWALINRLRATGYFTRNARMQINRKFNASELSALKLPLPPLPLQEEFAVCVSEIRAMQAEQTTSRRRLEHLFRSLLHRAFRGEL